MLSKSLNPTLRKITLSPYQALLKKFWIFQHLLNYTLKLNTSPNSLCPLFTNFCPLGMLLPLHFSPIVGQPLWWLHRSVHRNNTNAPHLLGKGLPSPWPSLPSRKTKENLFSSKDNTEQSNKSTCLITMKV